MSKEPSQPLIFDFIMRGGDESTPQNTASGYQTRSKKNQNLPERSPNQRSRKQKRAERKRLSKSRRSAQFNASRHLSGESITSSDSKDASPQSSPQPTRTFTQILADAVESQSDSDTSLPASDSQLALQEELDRYKQIAHDFERSNEALKTERELLNDDLNSLNKLLDRFKKENKRLTSENDKLRREQSKRSGLRQYSTSTCNTQTDDIPPFIQEAMDVSVAKFNSLCEQVSSIGQSLVENFSNAKMSAAPPTAPGGTSNVGMSNPPSATADGFQTVQSRKRQSKPQVPRQTQGNPIPVINTNATRTSPPCPTYAQATAQTSTAPRPRRAGQGARKRSKTIILGTSLTDGLSTELTKLGVPSTTHIYRGAKLDLLRERVPHIFSKDASKQPDKVVLLAGGNDAEETSADLTMNEYEGLVRDIRSVCPSTKIILSAIPPRKNNKTINDRIDEVNGYLYDRGQRKDNVYFVDVVPKDSKMFTKKKVHFNDEGKSVFAKNLKPYLMD